MSDQESLLSKESIEKVLNGARENLSQDGHVAPVLLVRFESGEERAVFLRHFPEVSGRKWAYLARLGVALRRTEGKFQEAVLVTESWFVQPKGEEQDLGQSAPSEHSDRREAIFVAGRDADKSRFSLVLQPFGRRLADSDLRMEGILDSLFAEPEKKREGA